MRLPIFALFLLACTPDVSTTRREIGDCNLDCSRGHPIPGGTWEGEWRLDISPAPETPPDCAPPPSVRVCFRVGRADVLLDGVPAYAFPRDIQPTYALVGSAEAEGLWKVCNLDLLEDGGRFDLERCDCSTAYVVVNRTHISPGCPSFP